MAKKVAEGGVADERPDAPVFKRKASKIEDAIKIPSFNVNPQDWLQEAVLVKVYYEEYEGKEDSENAGKVFDTLNFEFRGIDFLANPESTHAPRFVLTEFGITGPSKKGTAYDVLVKYQDTRLVALYDTFTAPGRAAQLSGGEGLGYDPNEPEGGTNKEYFTAVVRDFEEGRNGHPVYKTSDGKYIPVYLKLTYDNTGNLNPSRGNFIDKIMADRPTILRKGSDSQYIAPVKERRGAAQARVTGGNTTGGGTASTGSDRPKGF